MSVLYFGDPAGALALMDRGVTLCGVVHGRRGGRGWRGLVPRLGDLPRWRLPDLEDPALAAELSALEPRLIVAAFYPRLIPRQVLDIAPGINVHPSDLPRWRGPDPGWRLPGWRLCRCLLANRGGRGLWLRGPGAREFF